MDSLRGATEHLFALEVYNGGDTQRVHSKISLKAGGARLNLTAADTVIHYDPWWNPAVESL